MSIVAHLIHGARQRGSGRCCALLDLSQFGCQVRGACENAGWLCIGCIKCISRAEGFLPELTAAHWVACNLLGGRKSWRGNAWRREVTSGREVTPPRGRAPRGVIRILRRAVAGQSRFRGGKPRGELARATSSSSSSYSLKWNEIGAKPAKLGERGAGQVERSKRLAGCGLRRSLALESSAKKRGSLALWRR